MTRTAARSAAPERFPPARPRRRQPARATPPFTNRTSRVLALLVRLAAPDGDGGCRRRRPRRRRRPQRSEPPRPGLAPASAAGAKRGRSGRRTAPTVLATCHPPRRRGRGRPRARPPLFIGDAAERGPGWHLGVDRRVRRPSSCAGRCAQGRRQVGQPGVPPRWLPAPSATAPHATA